MGRAVLSVPSYSNGNVTPLRTPKVATCGHPRAQPSAGGTSQKDAGQHEQQGTPPDKPIMGCPSYN